MSYQVIARKYRPQRFSEVVGQEHITQTLIQAVEQKRIAHAYLFCGPRGTGKTTVARIFAKCLNCTGGPKVDFDPNDPKCIEIAEGRSMDVIEIDGASNNSVEQVRELRETCRYVPTSSPFKIYIIDEVHMLSPAAFNALLKTLEEPPAHVKFLFATTDPEKVLPTILSRCQRFDFRRIQVPLIVKQLKYICQKEGVEAEDAALYAIARGCDGGMRDAESALDQLISFCGGKLVEADVLSMYGLTAQNQLIDLAQAILQGDAPKALSELDQLAKSGKDLGRLIGDLLRHFRNLMIYQVTRGDLSLLEVSEAEAAALASQAKISTTEGISRIVEVLSNCELNLREAASKRILIEIALVRAIQARSAVSLDAVLQQLHKLRAQEAGGAVVSRHQTLAERMEPVPANSVASSAPVLTSGGTALAENKPVAKNPGGLDALWQQLISAVFSANPILGGYLQNAFPISLANGVLTIGFDPEFEGQRDLADQARYHEILRNKLQELGHSNTQTVFVLKEMPAGSAALQSEATLKNPPAKVPAESGPQPTGTLKDRFKNDPAIIDAIEIFKATLQPTPSQSENGLPQDA